jgi:hypothetical protein
LQDSQASQKVEESEGVRNILANLSMVVEKCFVSSLEFTSGE